MGAKLVASGLAINLRSNYHVLHSAFSQHDAWNERNLYLLSSHDVVILYGTLQVWIDMQMGRKRSVFSTNTFLPLGEDCRVK
jgi:hypothetical protein